MGLAPQVSEDGQHTAVVVLIGREVQFRQDAGDVLGDGRLGYHQRPRDGRVRPAFGHQPEDLPFSRREPLQRPALAVEQLPDHLRVNHRPARRHLGNRLGELGDLTYPVLQQVPRTSAAP